MVQLLSSVQLQGTFRRAMLQLVQIGFFQGLLLLGFAVLPPAQTAVPPQGSTCAPQPSYYTHLSELCLAMVLTLMASMASAMLPIQMLGENHAITGNGRSPGTVRFVRATAFVAVTLSLVTMALGLAVTFHLLVVKTTRVSCWSAAKTALAVALLAGAATVFVLYYIATFRVVLSSEVEEPAHMA